MRFAITLDVKEAIYTALGTADISGLGLNKDTTYVVSDAHVERYDETTWHFEIELERTSGAPASQTEVVNALVEYFDAELVVDIETLEQRP